MLATIMTTTGHDALLLLIAADAAEVVVGRPKEVPSVLLVPPPGTLWHWHHGP